jgi:hypothetical protein
VSANHRVEVEANTVAANEADRNGGGMDLLLEAHLLDAGDGVELLVTGNEITGNNAGLDGGGISALSEIKRSAVGGASPADALTLSIDRNTIRDNVSGLGGGGAILQPIADGDDFDVICGGSPAHADAFIDFTNNLVASNDALAQDQNIDVIGGGVLVLPVTFGDANAGVRIGSSTIASNTIGGGFVGGVEVQATTFFDCLTDTIAEESLLSIDRSIVASNSAAGIGGPLPIGDLLDVEVTSSVVFGHPTGNFESTLFPDGTPPTNVTTNPLLASGTFLPDACSPAFDVGGQVAGHVDPPDITGDSAIDGTDLLPIAAAFGATSGVEPRYDAAADLDRDGIVDGDELTYVGAEFGQVCP